MTTTTAPDQPDWAAGFEIQTTTTLVAGDGLGICIAELNSDQQANVLFGILEGFRCYPNDLARATQIGYIAAQFAGDDEDPANGRALAEFLEEIAEAIRDAIGEPS